MGKILEISLPSEELRKRIKDAAKARGCTTSKYLVYLFEESCSPARPALGQDVQFLREENRTLAGLLHETKHRMNSSMQSCEEYNLPRSSNQRAVDR
jgi:hypothetical protein